MFRKRAIPVLLLNYDELIKTVKFKNPKYIGDPINTVKIFNEKEVDEILLLDINASIQKKEPNFSLIKDIVSESFMPLSYGGGITSIDQIRRILTLGVEKVSINKTAVLNPNFIKEASIYFGSSTIIASIDFKKDFWGNYKVYINRGRTKTKYSPVEFAKIAEKQGAGELLINAIERDGTMTGYDLDVIQDVSNAIDIPVIACGGAGSILNLKEGIEHNATAVAAGSLFIYKGKHRAVLINYPEYSELDFLNNNYE